MHERFDYCKNIIDISAILWGYVLIWYSCGVCSIAVKNIELNTEKGLEIKHFRELKELQVSMLIASSKSRTVLWIRLSCRGLSHLDMILD